jgi:hypothetical protein
MQSFEKLRGFAGVQRVPEDVHVRFWVPNTHKTPPSKKNYNNIFNSF